MAQASDDGAVDFGEVFKLARRKPLNFALLVSKDKNQGMVLETHHKKPPAMLRRNAKRNGGGPKGAFGVMTISGKIVQLQCEDETVPGNMAKLAKKFFASQGFNYRFQFLLPNGEVIGGGEEDEDEAAMETAADTQAAPEAEETGAPQAAAAAEAGAESTPAGQATAADNADAARKTLIKAFKAMNEPLRAALASADTQRKGRLGTLAKAFGTEVKGDDLRRAATTLKQLKSELDMAPGDAAAESGASPDEAAERDQAAQEAAEAEARRVSRMADLGALESSIDDLWARLEEYA